VRLELPKLRLAKTQFFIKIDPWADGLGIYRAGKPRKTCKGPIRPIFLASHRYLGPFGRGITSPSAAEVLREEDQRAATGKVNA
jgi:hypothetical protein